MAYTEDYSTTLFADQQLDLVENLQTAVTWVTLVAIIAISVIFSCCLLVSVFRSFQEAAVLPSTHYGMPGRFQNGRLVEVATTIG